MALSPLPDSIGRAAALSPHAAALVWDGGTLTYRELDDLVARTCSALSLGGMAQPGSRVGVAALRRPSTVALLWAIWRLGAVAVVFDPESPLLAGGSERICDDWDLTDVLVAVDTSGFEPSGGWAAPEAASPHTWIPTSGSSGAARAVILTHGNVAAAVEASQTRLGNGPGDRWLLALPLFHVGGLSILWRSAAVRGSVFLMERFDPLASAAAMEDSGVTYASLVPTMLHRVLKAHPGPYGRMRAVLVGGAAAPPGLIERSLAARLPVLATYGMTETCSQVATVDPQQPELSAITVGLPLDGFEVTVDRPDESGVGEILVDGPAVSPGYAFGPPRRGPHRTGDLGRIDGDGRLVVLGRHDDMIITGGENVAPSAVEGALNSAREIAEIVVYGLPDPAWGEVVAASVVVASNGVDEAALDRAARALLPSSHRPRCWRIVASLPHLPNGKTDRAAAARHASEPAS